MQPRPVYSPLRPGWDRLLWRLFFDVVDVVVEWKHVACWSDYHAAHGHLLPNLPWVGQDEIGLAAQSPLVRLARFGDYLLKPLLPIVLGPQQASYSQYTHCSVAPQMARAMSLLG